MLLIALVLAASVGDELPTREVPAGVSHQRDTESGLIDLNDPGYWAGLIRWQLRVDEDSGALTTHPWSSEAHLQFDVHDWRCTNQIFTPGDKIPYWTYSLTCWPIADQAHGVAVTMARCGLTDKSAGVEVVTTAPLTLLVGVTKKGKKQTATVSVDCAATEALLAGRRKASVTPPAVR